MDRTPDLQNFQDHIERMRTERLARLQQEAREVQEEDYVNLVVQRALASKWVKQEEKGVLIEKILKPIFKKYLEIIEELRGLELQEEEFLRAVRLLNAALESTHRVGQTDPNNIRLSISDLKTKAEKWGFYEGWALSNFYSAVDQII